MQDSFEEAKNSLRERVYWMYDFIKEGLGQRSYEFTLN